MMIDENASAACRRVPLSGVVLINFDDAFGLPQDLKRGRSRGPKAAIPAGLRGGDQTLFELLCSVLRTV